MAFKSKDRQRIVDGYLAASGRNLFIAPEFIDWLQGQPEHEIYSVFFGKDDAGAAREWRIDKARHMVSGLRIVVRHEETISNVVHVTSREYPAFMSPMAARRAGGGYEPVDPRDEAHLAELRRQGAMALRGWLSRYRGAFEHIGADVSMLEEIVAGVDNADALSA